MTQQYDNIRKAIDVMTAWATDKPNSTEFSAERVVEYVREGGEAELLMGLVSLAGNLLVKLEGETDKSMQWHLQDIAQKIAEK